MLPLSFFRTKLCELACSAQDLPSIPWVQNETVPGATSAALCADLLPGVGCSAHVLLHSSSDTVLWCVFTFTSTSYRIGMSRRTNFLNAYSHQNENATVSRQKLTNPRSKELYSEDSCTGNVDVKCTFPVISNDCWGFEEYSWILCELLQRKCC